MILFSLLSFVFAQTADEIINTIQEQQTWSQSLLEIDLTIDRDDKKDKQYQLLTHLKKEQQALYTHTEFLQPTEVAGTKIIAINFPEKPDQLHLFMPALGRVNTLSSKARKHTFMGSDLSFEDLDISNYDGTHSILSEDATSWTIQTLGKEHPTYSKWISIINKANHQPTQIQFFDKKDTLLKTMTLTGEATQENPFPAKVDVIDPQRKSHTVFLIKNRSSEISEIPLSLFQKESLAKTKEQK